MKASQKNKGRHILRGRVATIPGHPVDLLDKRRVNFMVDYRLHHCQMLQVVVRLEQSVTCVKLDQDAANAPYVAGKGPPQAKYDFGRTIMSCAYDR